MPVVNALARELVFKVVYYGPGLGGKTSSLQFIHRASKPEHRGRMVSLATPVDRTLYFDFLPIRVPNIRNLSVRLQLFTVPGQVYYNATRRLVLTGADGVVFVADSQQARAEANLESIENLRENLQQHGRSLQDVPHVLQYNKRDLPELVTVEELEEALNWYGVPSFATIATNGEGVFESLEAVTRAVLEDFERRAPEQAPPSSRFEAPEGGLAEALRAAESSVDLRAPELRHPRHAPGQLSGELRLHANDEGSVISVPPSLPAARGELEANEALGTSAGGSAALLSERPSARSGAMPWSSFAKVADRPRDEPVETPASPVDEDVGAVSSPGQVGSGQSLRAAETPAARDHVPAVIQVASDFAESTKNAGVDVDAGSRSLQAEAVAGVTRDQAAANLRAQQVTQQANAVSVAVNAVAAAAPEVDRRLPASQRPAGPDLGLVSAPENGKDPEMGKRLDFALWLGNDEQNPETRSIEAEDRVGVGPVVRVGVGGSAPLLDDEPTGMAEVARKGEGVEIAASLHRTLAQPTAPSPPSDESQAALAIPPLLPLAVLPVERSVRTDPADEVHGAAPPTSFADLWEVGDRDAVLSLERALALGHFGKALETAYAVVQRELDIMGRTLSDRGEALPASLSVCCLLRVDTRRYLRLRAVALAWQDGTSAPDRRDALDAYLLALELRRSANELEREISDWNRSKR